MKESIFQKIKGGFRSNSKSSKKAHERTGEESTALTMTPIARVDSHQDIIDEAYAAGWAKAVVESKSSDKRASSNHADEPFNTTVSRPGETREEKNLNVTEIPHGSSGNYTNEYGPTSQAAVGGSISGNDVGVVANSNSSYEADAATETGRGYFFKPKEADVGIVPLSSGRKQEHTNSLEDSSVKYNSLTPSLDPRANKTQQSVGKSWRDSDEAASNSEAIKSGHVNTVNDSKTRTSPSEAENRDAEKNVNESSKNIEAPSDNIISRDKTSLELENEIAQTQLSIDELHNRVKRLEVEKLDKSN